MDAASPHRSGFVTLAGRSNVGKSTLINRLVGRKVAIVTPRPQTTRRRIVGIRNDPDAQIILIDTPGIHEPHRELNRRMVETARRCLLEGEVVVGVVEAGKNLGAADRAFLSELGRLKTPVQESSDGEAAANKVVALNKIDLVGRDDLMRLLEECLREVPQAEIVPVSALSGENVDELIQVIKGKLAPGPSLMSEDEYTDQTERMLAEEIVREKIFIAMRQEVPFSTAVTVEKFSEDPDRRLLRIAAMIIVERDSHKAMLIGAGGRQLKEIGTAARLELEDILGARVFLELRVKVERDWTRNPRKLKELGL